jgi:hypothetical protein
MVEVGDRVLVESEKVGSVTRSGVVTAVDDPLITVRWDSGSESVFVPSAGSLRVTRPRAARRAGRQVLSCRRRRRAPHPRAPSPRSGRDQLRLLVNRTRSCPCGSRAPDPEAAASSRIGLPRVPTPPAIEE